VLKMGPQTLQDLSITHDLANTQHDAWDRFSFKVTTSHGEGARLVFFRSGLITWRVHAIHLLQRSSVHQVSARRAALRRPVTPARPGCVAYGPVHTVTGYVTAETFQGRPKFTSIADADEPETYWILHFSRPICANENAQDLTLPAVSDVQRCS